MTPYPKEFADSSRANRGHNDQVRFQSSLITPPNIGNFMTRTTKQTLANFGKKTSKNKHLHLKSWRDKCLERNQHPHSLGALSLLPLTPRYHKLKGSHLLPQRKDSSVMVEMGNLPLRFQDGNIWKYYLSIKLEV